MMKNHAWLLGCLLLGMPLLASAWWQADWSSRRQISVDASATGADIQDTLTDVPVLIRLHAGNFEFFGDLADKGQDVRFIQDDKRVLPYQIEQLDTLSEIGQIWVKMPQVRGGISTDSFWMYYGNAKVAEAADSKNLYDSAQALVYHFQAGEVLPQDATAYLSHASDSKAQILPAGWIGAAAQFDGQGPISVKPVPQLGIAADKGWSFSTWLRIDQAQNQAKLLEALEGSTGVSLVIQGNDLIARWQTASSSVELPPIKLNLGSWQAISLVLQADKLSVFVDGLAVGSAAIRLTNVNPTIFLGKQLLGWLDEVQIAHTARSPDWLKWAFRNQSPDYAVLSFAQDETNDSGGDGHFAVIMQNVTPDGWLIIGLTLFMLLVALVVIVSKVLQIQRIRQGNAIFLDHYQRLDKQYPEQLLQQAELITAAHPHTWQYSPLYQLYQLSLSEVQKLQLEFGASLSEPAWHYVRVKMNTRITQENQSLQRHMVLLTIAIAGGPFLGLLGTVTGVMITFAVIAATGDVNINTIAPGIAAALLATVAGLAVAIPSLFAYNYLLTQIKDLSVAMRVFSDEFLAMQAMRAARCANI